MVIQAQESGTLQIQRTISGARAQVRQWISGGDSIALVPTMGNLHAGHMSLVNRARALADRVVVSVFVNPMQFGPREDYSAYPRTPEADHFLLSSAEVDLLFEPSVDEMYPDGQERAARVVVPGLSDVLCGATRPGHFVGVTTVVTKLLNIIQPTVAVFGEKDFQQLLIIRRLVADLNCPVEIASAPICREDDGLAMSSRNRYLSPEERAVAPVLHATLLEVAEKVLDDVEPLQEIQEWGARQLADAGLVPDYLEVRDRYTLEMPVSADSNLVILAAAGLGRTRLIDNVMVDRN